MFRGHEELQENIYTIKPCDLCDHLKDFLPFKTKLMLVQSLVLLIIDYVDVCYPDLNKVFNKLERLYNSGIRYMINLRKYDNFLNIVLNLNG